jgi:hypothetical protein
MEIGVFFFWGLVWALICCVIAGTRGRSVLGWWVLGLLFSVFALILLMCLPNLSGPSYAEQEIDRLRRQAAEAEEAKQEAIHLKRLAEINAAEGVHSNTIACPRCAETIKAAAKVCRYCGFEISDQAGTG